MSSTAFVKQPARSGTSLNPSRPITGRSAAAVPVYDENLAKGKTTAQVADRTTRSVLAPLQNAALRPTATKSSAIPIPKKAAIPAPAPAPIVQPKRVTAPTIPTVFDDSMDDAEMDDSLDREPMEIDESMDDSIDMNDIPAPAPKVLKNVIDIDRGDDDPQFCSEYVVEIFEHFREKEAANTVDSCYMEKQVDLSQKYRSIIVDWMAEVCVKFGLLSETLFLSVNILDRFLQYKAVARTRFQLVGIAAMLVASKFEEIYTPKVDDFIYITANAYKRDDLLKMEKMILVTLDFNLNNPSPIHFLRRFSKAAFSDSRVHTLSKYVVELSLLELSLLDYMPSEIAASAVYIARSMTGVHNTEPIWNSTIEYYTGYSVDEIMPCIQILNSLVEKQSPNYPYKATYRKYSAAKLLSVAHIEAVHI